MNNKLCISKEEAYNIFKSFLVDSHSLAEDCLDELCQRVVFKTVKKGELILFEGQVCDNIFFIIQGFCFSYRVWEGKEYILNFFKEKTFVVIFHSFFLRQSSFLNLKVSENTTLAILKYSDFVYLFDQYAEFKSMMCHVYIENLVREETIQSVFRCNSAEERIYFFLRSHEIQYFMQHVPQYRIASWLNMAPETFAKLWGNLSLP